MPKIQQKTDWPKLARQLQEMKEDERKEVIQYLAMAVGIVRSDMIEPADGKK